MLLWRLSTYSQFLEEIEHRKRRLVWNKIEQNRELFKLDGNRSSVSSYLETGLPHHLGCETYHYASYLREQLGLAKKSDVKCFFLFQIDSAHRAIKDRDSRCNSPIFAKDVYKEVLDEMEIEYVTLVTWDWRYRRGKKTIEIIQELKERGPSIVSRGDRHFFAWGVALNNIPSEYAKLNISKQLVSVRAPTAAPRPYQDDPIRFSLHIIKYAFDLLTNFQNEGFTFVFDPNSLRKTMTVSEAYSIQKPEYEADKCVFENGWSEIRELRLFEHFLKETIQLVDLQILDRLPDNARLLLIALVYFSRKKQVNCSAEAASVLLSYVTLSVVLEKSDSENLPRPPFPSQPVLTSSTDKAAATVADCNTAAAIMTESDYLSLCRYVDPKLDREIVYPLEEFQYCLLHLNYLNALCGWPVAPTAFRRTYAGSLVFRLRCAVKAAGDVTQFLRTLLSPAPTVLAFLSGLMEAYEEMLLTCQ